MATVLPAEASWERPHAVVSTAAHQHGVAAVCALTVSETDPLRPEVPGQVVVSRSALLFYCSCRSNAYYRTTANYSKRLGILGVPQDNKF
jgi:hypothetical protein